MRKFLLALALVVMTACGTDSWRHEDTYTDAFRLSSEARPVLSFDGDSVYTISNWYGVPGYDVRFVLDSIDDSTTIDIIGIDDYSNGFYYVETGLEDTPIAGISPGLFEPNHTILSGFNGDSNKGVLWSYVYLYDRDRKWVGGHYYYLYWGEAPAEPVWTVSGTCTLPGDPEGREGVLKAYADGHYSIPDWYGVEKYDLDFSVLADGGIRMLDYYAEEEDGSVWVQARRPDLGDPLVPQRYSNGGLEFLDCSTGSASGLASGSDSGTASGLASGSATSMAQVAPEHGRLHFAMTIYDLDDNPISDPDRPEFVFEW